MGNPVAKRKVNKSLEIREYVKANMDASAKEVQAALKQRNVNVTTAMVANVKSKSGLTKKRRGRPRKVAGAPVAVRNTAVVSSGEGVSLDTLIEAKRLVAKAGSAQQAVEVIRALQKLESIAS